MVLKWIIAKVSPKSCSPSDEGWGTFKYLIRRDTVGVGMNNDVTGIIKEMECRHEFKFDCVEHGDNRDSINIVCIKCQHVAETIVERVSTRFLDRITRRS